MYSTDSYKSGFLAMTFVIAGLLLLEHFGRAPEMTSTLLLVVILTVGLVVRFVSTYTTSLRERRETDARQAVRLDSLKKLALGR